MIYAHIDASMYIRVVEKYLEKSIFLNLPAASVKNKYSLIE